MTRIAISSIVFCCLACMACCAFAQTPAPLVAEGLAQFAGVWKCVGHFTASGMEIRSLIRMTWSDASNVMLVEHDDEVPFKYHATELWTSRRGGGLTAVIADPYSGARFYVSPAVSDGQLVWQREDGGKPVERFRYELDPARHLKVDWLTSRDGDAFSLGDSLNCVPSEAS